MLSWQIFTHSVKLVFRNFGAALRISGLLWLGMSVAIIWSYADILQSFQDIMQANNQITQDPMIRIAALQRLRTWGIGISLLQGIVTVWIAVSWHRYILLEEKPGAILPRMHIGKILGYILATILIMFVLAITMLVVMLLFGILSLVAGPIIASLSPFLLLSGAIFIILVPLAIFFVWLYLRVSLALPAIAIGKKITIGEAWMMTENYSKMFVMLAIIFGAFGVLLQLPVTMLPALNLSISPVADLGINMAIQWLASLVGISIMTTLYGVIVEGRKLT